MQNCSWVIRQMAVMRPVWCLLCASGSRKWNMPVLHAGWVVVALVSSMAAGQSSQHAGRSRAQDWLSRDISQVGRSFGRTRSDGGGNVKVHSSSINCIRRRRRRNELRRHSERPSANRTGPPHWAAPASFQSFRLDSTHVESTVYADWWRHAVIESSARYSL